MRKELAEHKAAADEARAAVAKLTAAAAAAAKDSKEVCGRRPAQRARLPCAGAARVVRL